MTAAETFNLLSTDIDKTITALLAVRTTEDMRRDSQLPGYVYNQGGHLHEYWIALGQYSFSANLSQLAFVVNDRQLLLPDILPKNFQSRPDLVHFIQMFKRNKGNIIASFDNIIDKPNKQFIFYAEPISMGHFLEKVVSQIHEDALNLEYNYNELKRLQSVAQN